MTISLRCTACRSLLDVKDRMRGLKGKCPRCGSEIEVPGERKPRQRPLTPATDKQKEFARELGIQFPEGISKGDISTLIDDALAADARERGVDLDALEKREGDVYEAVRADVLAETDDDDPRLSKATPHQIAEQLGNRGLGAILITFVLDDDFGSPGQKLELNLSSCDQLTRDDVKMIIANLALQYA